MNPSLVAVGMQNVNPAPFAFKHFKRNSFFDLKQYLKTRVWA